MATDDIPNQSRVGDDYSVRLPARVREELDVSPGDRIEWRVTDDGELAVEVVEQEYGVFDDAETVSLGGAADDHDCMGL
ncbi:AbrB/MazE/SpoVT family DNA-binding domain-containing protein [Halorussus ruber]|uniref:AbrB/MazE/SpoVT family DNA-binding domain-containing protein n=1 Tax=Halorussus ruber TaxID=1126238 RepID=UPI001091BC64|nr:AbrB/MazE/SpoVT family DNA-binding domain-containing protein [Halorussus ruber]